MMYETETALPGPEVLRRARAFFTERVPHHAAFPEQEGPAFATFRGQGGEELAIAVLPAARGTRVRASSLFFDQAIGRFFSTLPAPDHTASVAPAAAPATPRAGGRETAS